MPRQPGLRRERSRGRRVPGLLACLLLAGACGTAEPSPTPAASTAPPGPPAATAATAAPASGSTAPSPSDPGSTPTDPGPATARWEAAGTMHLAHVAPHLLLLGDGRALAVGSEAGAYGSQRYFESVSEDSRFAELWDSADGTWHETDPLNKPRAGFAAVTLDDGRLLVAGGLSPELQSYSSAYIFDPATEHWTKTGLMDTARAEPAAAVLADGRVLLAGGRYSAGVGDYPWAGAGDVELAAYRVPAGGDAPAATPPVDDSDPGPVGHPLATAEIFDPETGTWSETGPMRYARVGAQAVTLGDGRVLVWGANWGSVGDQAEASGEIYDPRSGRFQAAPPVPAVTQKAALRLGLPAEWVDEASSPYSYGARLMALAGGDALLVGIWTDWGEVIVVQTVRFDASRDEWRRSGELYATTDFWEESDAGKHWGTRHPDGIMVPLPDGQVLFAGGSRARAAELYDPGSETWSSLPRMPAARTSGRGVVLRDGSVLVVGSGGYTDAFRLILGS